MKSPLTQLFHGMMDEDRHDSTITSATTVTAMFGSLPSPRQSSLRIMDQSKRKDNSDTILNLLLDKVTKILSKIMEDMKILKDVLAPLAPSTPR